MYSKRIFIIDLLNRFKQKKNIFKRGIYTTVLKEYNLKLKKKKNTRIKFRHKVGHLMLVYIFPENFRLYVPIVPQYLLML